MTAVIVADGVIILLLLILWFTDYEYDGNNCNDYSMSPIVFSILVPPHSNTEQHKNFFLLSAPPPTGTTLVTTRWRPHTWELQTVDHHPKHHLTYVCTQSNMVLNVHRNNKAY